jgi:hypothetical protein
MVALAAYAPSTYSPTIIVGPMTFNQLATQYTSANIVGFPAPFMTSDAGVAIWNGTAWIRGLRFTLLSLGVDFIFPPSGTMGNNGAYTLGGTGLDTTYSKAYMYCTPGQIFTGSGPGWYYTTMTSATAGIVYNNLYRFGQAPIPFSPIAFSSTGPGVWTSLVNTAITGPTCNIPAFAPGLNGRMDIKINWSTINNTNSKGIAINYEGNAVGGTDYETTAQHITTTRTIINKGATNIQGYSGATSAGAIANGTMAVDTTLAQSIWIYFNMLNAATDWIVLHDMTVDLTPAGVLDTPLIPLLTPASPSIVPPGAAALGYTTNVWFVNPTSSMISIGSATPLQSVSSLAHYSDTVVNGISYLSINQLGDGTNTACFTSPPSTLATLPSAGGWYFEAAVTLTSNHPDHWQSIYSDPIEKIGSSTTPFVEVDGMEQIGARSTNDPFYGNTTSVINWGSGSGSGSTSDTTNLSPPYFGPNIDWTQEHVFGYSYDPIGKKVSYWIDGVKMPLSISTASFDANIATLHYVLVLQAASHTIGAGGVPYSMLVRYFSAWN